MEFDFDSVYTWLTFIVSIITAIMGIIQLFFNKEE